MREVCVGRANAAACDKRKDYDVVPVEPRMWV